MPRGAKDDTYTMRQHRLTVAQRGGSRPWATLRCERPLATYLPTGTWSSS